MRWRLVAALVATTLLVVLVQVIPLSFTLQQVQHTNIITGLERDAFVLAGRSEEALEDPTPDAVALVTEAVQQYREASAARVVVVDAAGTAIATSDADDSRVGASYASRPEIAQALGGEIATGTRFSQTLQEDLLYVSVPVLSGDRVLGAVRITYPAHVVDDAVASQLGRLWLVALTTVLLSGVVGYIVAAGVTRRLERLRASTERLADGHLDERAEEDSGAAELRSLSHSFNTMAERLERLIAQQRQFAADASHQLRTPLTALRLKLERARALLLDDPAGAAQRLAAAEREADRLGALIEGLLLLSRTEASAAEVVSIDLGEVARQRVEHWRPLCEESGVAIEYLGPQRALVRAVPTAPEQIIDNVVDNAISVSPVGSTIRVCVDARGAMVELRVLDEGPGLAPDARARAFDRFWRADSSSEGSGLGLAIVAQLAKASGGDARLEPRDGGGLSASVTFAAGA